MEHNEYMEVDDDMLPNLQCIGKMPDSKTSLAPATPGSPNYPNPMQISFFPVKKEPTVQLSIRQQQTNQPTCPAEFSPPGTDAVAGNFAPGLEGFDDFLPQSDIETPGIPMLSADEVDKELEPLTPFATADSNAPSMPEVLEASSVNFFLPDMVPREPVPTISLMPDTDFDASDCLFGDDQHLIIHELMDDDISTDQCDHIPIPSVCQASSSQHRQYDDAARYISELHIRLAQDVPHAKKKPMLHEFLGYILFQWDSLPPVLQDSIYFCRKNGDRVPPQHSKKHFRVANFQAVSEVWKRIKCNSSKDCTKNMKRAMRMSTTNDRNYFVNLCQRMHRLQVFKFGDRSIEIFKRLFPDWY